MKTRFVILSVVIVLVPSVRHTPGDCPPSHPICAAIPYGYCAEGGPAVNKPCTCEEFEPHICSPQLQNQLDYFHVAEGPVQPPKKCWQTQEIPCIVYHDCVGPGGGQQCSSNPDCTLNEGAEPLIIFATGYRTNGHSCS